ncbi:MAG: hypothetical protein ACRDTG_27855 [Pseudonocardiaceae bacterium]
MTSAMSLWMRYRKHSWLTIVEMATAMVLPSSMVRVVIDAEVPGPDPQLRRARLAALAALGTALLTSLIMPGIGLLFERSLLWIGLGALGIVAFVAAQAGVLYAVVTPWLTEASRRRLLATLAVAMGVAWWMGGSPAK